MPSCSRKIRKRVVVPDLARVMLLKRRGVPVGKLPDGRYVAQLLKPCGETWTGLNVAHCSACHRTFSSIVIFDAHRDQRGERGTCLDPADLVWGSGAKAGQPRFEFYGSEGNEEGKGKRFEMWRFYRPRDEAGNVIVGHWSDGEE